MQNELVFKLKKLFSPDNKLSSWILKLTLIRNDLFYVHRSLIDYLDCTKKAKSGEFIYYFRLAASHYREAAKYISRGKNKPEIQAFIQELSDNTINNYKLIIESCTPWKSSFVNQIVKPIRDNFFHYDIESFEEDYNQLEDFFTRIISTGNTRKETELIFADELSINLIFGNKSRQDIEKILSELSTYMSALISFVDETVGRFINNNKNKSAYIIRVKN
ncbi:hypothetical protein D7Z26_09390 [Cohnella endophytica]|uniref:HEPN AbiU2-like domain-containing protein n=1 Tax=Cohnella endophytica TaxID=2419778 RepID=A0A494XXT8_9BACL|nr:hypothetical protein [Cohnella endophytica]RKP55395.1 hypothetical protein D7Z26_09390 [Cohnella endophytica]